MNTSLSLYDIANLLQGTVIGDDISVKISNLSPIDDILPNSLVFAEGSRNIKIAENSMAGALLVGLQVKSSNKPLIQVVEPRRAFSQLLNFFNPTPPIIPGIHPSASIGKNVKLGKDVFIGPYVVINDGAVIGNFSVLKSHIHVGSDVIIGEHTIIHPQVTIYDKCHIGSKVIIHASTVIGSDGFGYTLSDGQHLKVPHRGRVEIQDNVEIGANSAIDRATLGATVIGKGTKIDNLVQVAHSVKLGKNNILCALSGIAGSSSTGDNVIFAANVGVSDHVTIEDNVILGVRTGVMPNKHLKANTVYYGSPAKPKDIAIKNELAVQRIPLIRKNIKTLTERINLLTKRLNQLETQKS